jgi:hypothetical protein
LRAGALAAVPVLPVDFAADLAGAAALRGLTTSFCTGVLSACGLALRGAAAFLAGAFLAGALLAGLDAVALAADLAATGAADLALRLAGALGSAANWAAAFLAAAAGLKALAAVLVAAVVLAAAFLAGGFFHRHRLGRAEFESHRHFAPDFFEVVVVADGGLHDVRHGGAAVHDDPFTVLFALGARLGRLADGLDGLSRTLAASALVWRLEVPEAMITRSNSGDRCFGVEDLTMSLGLDVFEPIDDGSLEFDDVLFGSGFRGGGSGHQAMVGEVMGVNIARIGGGHQRNGPQVLRMRAAGFFEVFLASGAIDTSAISY